MSTDQSQPPANPPSLQHPPQAGAWARQPMALKTAVVGAAGVAVTALGLVAPSTAPAPGDLSTLANGCSIEGSASDNQWEWSANALKNRWQMPSADDDLNADVTLAVLAGAASAPKPSGPNSGPVSGSAPGANGTVQFSEGQTAEVQGWIAYVKPGGVESCNCKSQDPQYMDTHIYVSPTPDHANPSDKKYCVIVEATPRVRILQAQMGHDWSTSTLVTTLKPGTHVQISGYLFDDQEHRPNSLIDSPSASNLWRASCWELHPVTDIQILGGS